MVDGVNFNPFTGKVLTAEEIQKLDENKDGIVSYEELNNNISWISSEQDAEGEVKLMTARKIIRSHNLLKNPKYNWIQEGKISIMRH